MACFQQYDALKFDHSVNSKFLWVANIHTIIVRKFHTYTYIRKIRFVLNIEDMRGILDLCTVDVESIQKTKCQSIRDF